MTDEQLENLYKLIRSQDLDDLYLAGSMCSTFKWSKNANIAGYRVPNKYRPLIKELRSRLYYWGNNYDNMTHEQILRLWMDNKLQFTSFNNDGNLPF